MIDLLVEEKIGVIGKKELELNVDLPADFGTLAEITSLQDVNNGKKFEVKGYQRFKLLKYEKDPRGIWMAKKVKLFQDNPAKLEQLKKKLHSYEKKIMQGVGEERYNQLKQEGLMIIYYFITHHRTYS